MDENISILNHLIKLISSESKNYKPPCVTCIHKYVPILEKAMKDNYKEKNASIHIFIKNTFKRCLNGLKTNSEQWLTLSAVCNLLASCWPTSH